MSSKILGALALVILAAAAGWYVLHDGRPTSRVLEASSITADTVEPEARAALNSVAGLLRGVTDTASADRIVPAIQATTFKLNAVAAAAAKMPAERHAALAKAGEEIGAQIQKEITRIQQIPGAWDILNPKMERFLLLTNILAAKNYQKLGTDNPA